MHYKIQVAGVKNQDKNIVTYHKKCKGVII